MEKQGALTLIEVNLEYLLFFMQRCELEPHNLDSGHRFDDSRLDLTKSKLDLQLDVDF